ncbi:MAG: hypothetical protein JKY33_00245, partial [Bacteroidia bacterium]|nr:hypothetical protein [Bacteroidia bacterium]
FPDQFGGPKQKKYSTKRAQQFFGSLQHLDIRDQEKALDREISNWKGIEEQIDDILVIGVRF